MHLYHNTTSRSKKSLKHPNLAPKGVRKRTNKTPNQQKVGNNKDESRNK